MKFIAFSRERPDIHGDRKNENKSGGVLGFIKKNTVLMVALAAALVTSFIVPPDREYFGYFDFKTLCCLSAFWRSCARSGTSIFSISSPEGLSRSAGTYGCR